MTHVALMIALAVAGQMTPKDLDRSRHRLDLRTGVGYPELKWRMGDTFQTVAARCRAFDKKVTTRQAELHHWPHVIGDNTYDRMDAADKLELTKRQVQLVYDRTYNVERPTPHVVSIYPWQLRRWNHMAPAPGDPGYRRYALKHHYGPEKQPKPPTQVLSIPERKDKPTKPGEAEDLKPIITAPFRTPR